MARDVSRKCGISFVWKKEIQRHVQLLKFNTRTARWTFRKLDECIGCAYDGVRNPIRLCVHNNISRNMRLWHLQQTIHSSTISTCAHSRTHERNRCGVVRVCLATSHRVVSVTLQLWTQWLHSIIHYNTMCSVDTWIERTSVRSKLKYIFSVRSSFSHCSCV